jgi:hypothetical protein
MNMVDLSSLYDEPIDPAIVEFTTKPGKKCRTCFFVRQRQSVCDQVEMIAKRAGMALCDLEDVDYIERLRDDRQLTIGE